MEMPNAWDTDTRWRRAAKSLKAGAWPALAGATAFWVPDVILHAVTRGNFRLASWLLTQAAMIGCVALAYRRFLRTKTAGFVAPWFILGIWIMGNVFMTIGATFLPEGGFSHPKVALAVIAMGIVPIYTFISATYDTSLGALLLVTLALFIKFGQSEAPMRNNQPNQPQPRSGATA